MQPALHAREEPAPPHSDNRVTSGAERPNLPHDSGLREEHPLGDPDEPAAPPLSSEGSHANKAGLEANDKMGGYRWQPPNRVCLFVCLLVTVLRLSCCGRPPGLLLLLGMDPALPEGRQRRSRSGSGDRPHPEGRQGNLAYRRFKLECGLIYAPSPCPRRPRGPAAID